MNKIGRRLGHFPVLLITAIVISYVIIFGPPDLGITDGNESMPVAKIVDSREYCYRPDHQQFNLRVGEDCIIRKWGIQCELNDGITWYGFDIIIDEEPRPEPDYVPQPEYSLDMGGLLDT